MIMGGGITRADTAAITITNPLTATVLLFTSSSCCVPLAVGESVMLPSAVAIVPGGTVTWQNRTGSFSDSTSFALAFDNPRAVAGGDIPAFKAANVSHTFPAAGIHTYRATVYNLTRNTTSVLLGKVIVE